MKNFVSIDNSLLALCPDTSLGLCIYETDVRPASGELTGKFDEVINLLAEKYTLDEIASLPHIDSTRKAYRLFGADPHRYRNAAEAMLRRIVKGSGLYRINNVVDINNIVSVSSGYSIGSYDLNTLSGHIQLRIAPVGTHYEGIGKDSVNVSSLPVLYDENGPFGNPTGDSRHSMIKEGNREIMTVIYSFDGKDGLEENLGIFKGLLETYCTVNNVETKII